MITVAIAVRDTTAAKQYRALLLESGIDAHFASDIPTLIRLVKGRPIDVVVFDLARNALSINSWLVEVSRDRDLALAPVLWIGSGILPEMKRVVEEYRPGIYLPKLPELDELKTAINTLVGRIPPVAKPQTAGSTAEPIDEPAWKPAENNIEDALSIFAEGGRAAASNLGRPTVPERPKETIPFPTSGQSPKLPAPPKPAQPLMAPPASTPPEARDQNPPPAGAGLSPSELSSLAEQVSARLAGDILKRLNRDDLKRLVEQVMAETSITIS